MSDNNNNSLLWFITGLGLGALVGVLYAPKSGRETREMLARKADEGRELAVQRGRQLRDQANELASRGREVYGRQKEQVSSALEAAKQAYREAAEGPSKS